MSLISKRSSFSVCHSYVLTVFIQTLFVHCRVNLALAYTELTEELGRVRSLAAKQSDLLRYLSQEPGRSLDKVIGARTSGNRLHFASVSG